MQLAMWPGNEKSSKCRWVFYELNCFLTLSMCFFFSFVLVRWLHTHTYIYKERQKDRRTHICVPITSNSFIHCRGLLQCICHLHSSHNCAIVVIHCSMGKLNFLGNIFNCWRQEGLLSLQLAPRHTVVLASALLDIGAASATKDEKMQSSKLVTDRLQIQFNKMQINQMSLQIEEHQIMAIQAFHRVFYFVVFFFFSSRNCIVIILGM